MMIGDMGRAQQIPNRSRNGVNPAFAWLVHLYTALGAVAAFFAATAVLDRRYRDSFLLMLVATVIDSTDGLLARKARVGVVVPQFDGARLDDIVDYLTFVFVPLLLLHHSGRLPPGWGALVASAVLVSSAYGFGSLDAKTSDHFFTGFPSYWNIAALYLFAAGLSPVANGVILLVLSAFVFVRTGYIYPSKTPVLRRVTIALGVVWGAMIAAIILSLPDVNPVLLRVSLFYPLYYSILSFVLDRRRARSARTTA
jgi:phosphatidylcholine synthase